MELGKRESLACLVIWISLIYVLSVLNIGHTLRYPEKPLSLLNIALGHQFNIWIYLILIDPTIDIWSYDSITRWTSLHPRHLRSHWILACLPNVLRTLREDSKRKIYWSDSPSPRRYLGVFVRRAGLILKRDGVGEGGLDGGVVKGGVYRTHGIRGPAWERR